MTASQSAEPRPFLSPIVDYEPAPVGSAARTCPPPTPAVLHRQTPRPLRAVPEPGRELRPPPVAAAFAEAALRRVLEVLDRRRPVGSLRPILTTPLIDVVAALRRTSPSSGAGVLRRVRIRTADQADGEAVAAEVFGTFSRGPRVHAVAGRIEVVEGRWRLTALQLG